MTTPSTKALKIQIFADGADIKAMREAAANPLIKGFTTNPTLMRAAGVSDYKAFAHEVLQAIPDRPISFEVFADDFPTMEQQAREIASWGKNVYVKIPVSNTKGDFAGPLIATLARAGVKLNVTAVMTLEQVSRIGEALSESVPAVVSVFAGRIADTGRDPVPHMKKSLELLRNRPKAELLWASPREVLNIFQADGRIARRGLSARRRPGSWPDPSPCRWEPCRRLASWDPWGHGRAIVRSARSGEDARANASPALARTGPWGACGFSCARPAKPGSRGYGSRLAPQT